MPIADVFPPQREVLSALKLFCGMPPFSLFQSICFFSLSSNQSLAKGQNKYKLKNMRIGYLISIHKLGFLFKIKACEKNNHPDGKSVGTGTHMFNISRIIF